MVVRWESSMKVNEGTLVWLVFGLANECMRGLAIITVLI